MAPAPCAARLLPHFQTISRECRAPLVKPSPTALLPQLPEMPNDKHSRNDHHDDEPVSDDKSEFHFPSRNSPLRRAPVVEDSRSISCSALDRVAILTTRALPSRREPEAEAVGASPRFRLRSRSPSPMRAPFDRAAARVESALHCTAGRSGGSPPPPLPFRSAPTIPEGRSRRHSAPRAARPQRPAEPTAWPEKRELGHQLYGDCCHPYTR
jgi:hypothetical protein